MGNMHCPAEDAALLASVARDICPFPDYNPSPLVFNMLSVNSSLHLRNHYAAVQSSLTPKQLEDFNQGLRSTFGRGGKVTLGGVGVVALSLALLFDTIAKQVKGEWVSDSGPIPGLFLKDVRGQYPLHVHTVSEYLRLVPHIANNPTMMREESERYFKQTMIDIRTMDRSMGSKADDIKGLNFLLGELFQEKLEQHLLRITNSTVIAEIVKSVRALKNRTTETGGDAARASKTRKRRMPPYEDSIDFQLNCDPEAASNDFLAEVQKSNATQEAFKRCEPRRYIPKTWLHFTAGLVFMDTALTPNFDNEKNRESLIAQREDFDLKAHALRKWAE